MVGLNPRFSRIKTIIFFVVLLICLGGVFWLFVGGDISYLNSLQRRVENDYIVREYQVEKINERTYLKNNKPIYSYLSFGLRDETISLSTIVNFVNNHARSQEQKEDLLDKIKIGDIIKVKIYQPELLEAEKNNPLLWLKRFVMVDNREVQIYRLEKNGKVIIPDVDIKQSSRLGRQGSNVSYTRLIMIIIFGGILIVIVRRVVGRRRED